MIKDKLKEKWYWKGEGVFTKKQIIQKLKNIDLQTETEQSEYWNANVEYRKNGLYTIIYRGEQLFSKSTEDLFMQLQIKWENK